MAKTQNEKAKARAKKWKSRAKGLIDQLEVEAETQDALKSELKAAKKAAKKAKKKAKQCAASLAKAGNAADPEFALVKPPVVAPLAPKDGFPLLPIIDGVEFAAVASELRYTGRPDLMLAYLAPGTVMAGSFTTSGTRSASVLDCQAKIAHQADADKGAAILVNAGNANAFTGVNGAISVAALTHATADMLGLPESRVFTSSTGVIGVPLPHDHIIAHLEALTDTLDPASIAQAARAILTTDTFPKGAMAEIEIDGQPIRIAGIAKGSGMIAPNMATMLVYIFTDAKISDHLLQPLVKRLTDRSFNCITVDSDTSTSDTLLVAATGQSPAPALTPAQTAPGSAFEAALSGVMLDLAHQVVRDGEGATKFVTINVTGGRSNADAKRCAMAIANSPLVKTAIAGEDPNWGRIVAAIGKSGAEADRDQLGIRFGDIQVATNGQIDPNYTEDDGAEYMLGEEIEISVSLGIAHGTATVWTCDLTKRYIEINADYRS